MVRMKRIFHRHQVNNSMIKFSDYLLLEKNSSVYYHDTNLNALDGILRNNKFALRSALLKGADSRTDNLKYPYFMSLSRNRANSYRVSGNVTLVLNGRELNSNYKVVPLDYWGQEFKKLGKAEMEDRLLSRKSIIPNAKRYIDEIHVYVGGDTIKNTNSNSIINTLTYYDNESDSGPKVYFYDNRKDLYHLNKKKSVSIDLTDVEIGYGVSYEESSLDKFSEFLDFVETGHTRKYYKEWLRNPSDFISSGVAELHNFYMNSSGVYGRMLTDRVVKMMRAENTSDPKQFFIKRYSKLTNTPEDKFVPYLR